MSGNFKACCENIDESVRKRRILLCSLFWVLIFVAFAMRVIKYYHKSSNVQPSNDKIWDYIVFSQSWPVSYCIKFAEKNKNLNDGCEITKTDDRPIWTVHGIWPSRRYSNLPEYCNVIPAFNVTDLEPILNELSVYWASGHQTNSRSSSSFWKHEWLKHGTCAQTERLNTMLEFFSQGLDWYKQFNVGKTLDKCDISPDDSKLYTNAQIVDCFKKHFDVTPKIRCEYNKISNKYLLQEVRLCIDQTLTLKSCDILATEELCIRDFMYPATVALKV